MKEWSKREIENEEGRLKKDRGLGKGKVARKRKEKLKIENRMRKECARKWEGERS